MMGQQSTSDSYRYNDAHTDLVPNRPDSAFILVIDDTTDISDVLEDVITGEGWHAHSEANAEQGIAFALAHPPDLILLDVTLPDMDGFEVCRSLREHEATADVPIIFLTAHARAHERVQGLDAGGNDYIVKPFNIDELLARVRAALRTKIAQDILRQANSQLVVQTQTDPLTGLYNRRFLDERLAEEVVRALRYGYPLACCLLDVDHFKAVNDSYGHQDGDEVLRSMAAILRDQVRRDDIVARYGGEEFIVLLIQQDLQGALRVAEKIRTSVAEMPFRLSNGATLDVTVSIGVSAGAGPSLNQEHLVAAADAALYAAKRDGRNRVAAGDQQAS